MHAARASRAPVLTLPSPTQNKQKTGAPIDLIQPATLRAKVEEPLLLLGKQRFGIVDIRVRCKGGGRVAQIYGARECGAGEGRGARRCSDGCDRWVCRRQCIAPSSRFPPAPIAAQPNTTAIRQAIAKGLVAYYQKCESSPAPCLRPAFFPG